MTPEIPVAQRLQERYPRTMRLLAVELSAPGSVQQELAGDPYTLVAQERGWSEDRFKQFLAGGW